MQQQAKQKELAKMSCGEIDAEVTVSGKALPTRKAL
jgi:hypothetical protein